MVMLVTPKCLTPADEKDGAGVMPQSKNGTLVTTAAKNMVLR
jgi:hypothetical protein